MVPAQIMQPTVTLAHVVKAGPDLIAIKKSQTLPIHLRLHKLHLRALTILVKMVGRVIQMEAVVTLATVLQDTVEQTVK